MSAVQIPESPLSRFIFADTRMAWFWLIVRIYVGWQWLDAGWDKIQSPAWFGSEAGAAMAKFLGGALQKTSGAHPDVQSWYAWFIENLALPNAEFLANLISIGEVAVGMALILGAFAGIAAFFGIIMNVNFLLAGSVSINPILLLLQIFLVLAWRIAGWLGLDRYLLPALGTPWQAGRLFRR